VHRITAPPQIMLDTDKGTGGQGYELPACLTAYQFNQDTSFWIITLAKIDALDTTGIDHWWPFTKALVAMDMT
jgi:hypothetical protein